MSACVLRVKEKQQKVRLFRAEFNKFNNTGLRMLDSFYHYNICNFCEKKLIFIIMHVRRYVTLQHM